MIYLLLALSLHSNVHAYDYIDVKDACRQKIMGGDKAQYQANEKVEDLVDLGARALRNIEVMDSKKLNQAHLEARPWSDYYWPIASGIIANRYADPEMPGYDWKQAFDYVKNHPVSSYVGSERAELLSPAEKYSLVSGDQKNVLAQTLWQEGKMYLDQTGSVESWMGICHGWSAASLMLPAPSKKVNYKGVNFYPSDIKALGSLLWANGQFSTKFIGGRCNQKNPKRDEFGRIKDQDCFDINPGTWHMAIVNQIGISNRGFVMDATYDYQVWNQPVYRYWYGYFNPQTQKETQNFKDAVIAYKTFSHDKFSRYRKNQVKNIVGVTMNVEYVTEVTPDHEEGPFISHLDTAQYVYDLELDDQNNIIGGEWHSENHPDFLWVPSAGAKVQTPGDAISNASRGLPLSSTVEELFMASKEQ